MHYARQLAVLPVLRLRRGRHEPAGEHHRLGAEAVPRTLQGQEADQVGRLPLRLRRPPPPRIPDQVRGQPQEEPPMHPVRPGLPGVRRRRPATRRPAPRVRGGGAVRAGVRHHARRTAQLPRREDGPEQGQDPAGGERVADPGRHPDGGVRLPARQPVGPGVGDRPVPRDRGKRSGIRSDPNRADDPEYIVRLVGQVVAVSVETVRIVAGLPAEYADRPPPPG